MAYAACHKKDDKRQHRHDANPSLRPSTRRQRNTTRLGQARFLIQQASLLKSPTQSNITHNALLNQVRNSHGSSGASSYITASCPSDTGHLTTLLHGIGAGAKATGGPKEGRLQQAQAGSSISIRITRVLCRPLKALFPFLFISFLFWHTLNPDAAP